MKKLTIKQNRFADEYIISGNATEAAIKAGYSKKTASETGYENLRKPHIATYIKERVDEVDNNKIADIKEVREFWTGILRNRSEDTRDRLKASEYIAKTQGAFIDRVDVNADVNVNNPFNELTSQELRQLIKDD